MTAEKERERKIKIWFLVTILHYAFKCRIFLSRSNNVARLNLLRAYIPEMILRVECAIEKVNNIFSLKVYYNVQCSYYMHPDIFVLTYFLKYSELHIYNIGKIFLEIKISETKERRYVSKWSWRRAFISLKAYSRAQKTALFTLKTQLFLIISAPL